MNEENGTKKSEMSGEDKRQHLIFIEDAITRMASNSFLIKGWSVAGIGALYFFWIESQNILKLWLILTVTILFWMHDAYYHNIERNFRAMYNKVRQQEPKNIDYSMEPGGDCSFVKTAVRPVFLISYAVVTVATALLITINLCGGA